MIIVFTKEDMLHPSDQAVEYIWQTFFEIYFAPETMRFLEIVAPVKEALGHRPFNPDSDEYRAFMAKTMQRAEMLETEISRINHLKDSNMLSFRQASIEDLGCVARGR